MKRIIVLLLLLNILTGYLAGQSVGLVNTSQSKYAMLSPTGINEVQLSGGFWAQWFATCRDEMVPGMMANYMDDSISHAFANFEIAAGLKEGEHIGPPFHDGDFYKILEALIMVNAVERNPESEKEIDRIAAIIAQTQREDGYIHSPVMIEARHSPETASEFRERLDFETYNMGHLMTAACLHYRTTGKENLLDIARGAADFLYNFYKRNPEELAENAICPSHYMGVTELYRTTMDPRYLELAKGLIDIRAVVQDGTDHNQDRIPFREQRNAVGHAVRANYLYAGAADVFAETGDSSLLTALESIWKDLDEHKIYITGGCGALYDGVSPNGTSYDPAFIQQVHQAYGQEYELPNHDAHNESCANIGNLLWNWRMLQIDGKAAYADMLEQVAYNVLLAGVSLDGNGYFYTNPLAVSQDLPYELRWSKTREPYISYCNCCPPNTIRTVAEIQNYFYSISDAGLWLNLYGSNELKTTLKDGASLELSQESAYPWDGNVRLSIQKAPRHELSLFFRIPAWCENYELFVNGKLMVTSEKPGNYLELRRKWKKGDQVQLNLEMESFFVEANPLVEENQNMLAVQRGPVVYCLETHDLPEGVRPSDVLIPVDAKPEVKVFSIKGAEMMVLEVDAFVKKTGPRSGDLYTPIKEQKLERIKVQLIPYYAWGNRGEGDMAVWLGIMW